MGKIKNFGDVAVTPARKLALKLAEAGLAAIDTGAVVRAAVRLDGEDLRVQDQVFSMAGVKRVLLVGVGKCALEAAGALEDILGDRITDGVVVDIRDGTLKRIRTYAGTHPFPTEANIDATRQIIDLLSGLTPDDLAIFIISGGGSTLLCQPGNFTCHMESSVIAALFRAGAAIQEINTIRKHLSSARGGHLAQYAYPARVLGLVFSDVAGDDLQAIASGPTVKDETAAQEARAIMEKHGVQASSGFSPEELMETPKDDKYFQNVANIVLVNNGLALAAMRQAAEGAGFAAVVVSATLSGEAADQGRKIAAALREAKSPAALLYGGETTVTIRGRGKGGRNLELALAAVPDLQAGELVLAMNTDGRDNSDFAGAVCDTMTMERAKAAGLDPAKYLADNDSYGFFEKNGDFLLTGHTGANVADLIIALKT